MTQFLSAIDIEDRAREAGMTLTDLCKKAQIAQSTFTRWKAGVTQPNLDVYKRLVRAVVKNGGE